MRPCMSTFPFPNLKSLEHFFCGGCTSSALIRDQAELPEPSSAVLRNRKD